MRQVINRAGIKENLDITKIREKLIRACRDLDVSMIKLESSIDSIYEENITTKKIQESLINQAVSMTSFEESDWTYVAGRLLMMETEREVFHKRGFSYGNFQKTIEFLTEKNIYDKRLLSYTKEEINILQNEMNTKRDMLYDYAGANMFVNRYLLKYNGNIFELPQEVFMCIAMLLAINEKNKIEVAKRFYHALSLKKSPWLHLYLQILEFLKEISLHVLLRLWTTILSLSFII